MRVLVLHNRYHNAGGEDRVVALEAQLLRRNGIEVREFSAQNDEHAPALARLRDGWQAAWSRAAYAAVRQVCEEFRPDVAHVHNFWMRLSPSVHAACRDAGAATVQTLHNGRLLCVNALFLRDGRPCTDCIGKLPWRGVVHRCYRGSFVASAALARMIVTNRRRGTWKSVDAFIALTDTARQVFLSGGFPPERVFVKPNFAVDCGRPCSPPSASQTVLYAGRLSPEKGVSTLLAAWRQAGLSHPAKLVVAGDGPCRSELQAQAASDPTVTSAGLLSAGQIAAALATCRALVLPSQYEGFPMALVEAFSYGRPVIATNVGGVNEILDGGRYGLCLPYGDVAALAKALRWILESPNEADRLGMQARSEYEKKYSPETNFATLMHIYRFAVQHRRGAGLRADQPCVGIYDEQYPGQAAGPGCRHQHYHL